MLNILLLLSKKEKADLLVQGKEETQMNTTMIFNNLKHERYENTLDAKQSFASEYIFLRERNHMFRGKNGI